MSYIASHVYLTGYNQGECPVCGFAGVLYEVHTDAEMHTRTLVHGGQAQPTDRCVMPLEGTLYTRPDGTWEYEAPSE